MGTAADVNGIIGPPHGWFLHGITDSVTVEPGRAGWQVAVSAQGASAVVHALVDSSDAPQGAWTKLSPGDAPVVIPSGQRRMFRADGAGGCALSFVWS